MATPESLSTESAMNQYDADELGQYRSLSSMAVVSAVLGCCSVLMFATPLMVVLPLAAAATALLALRGIANSDGGLTGARLALAGLALAMLFGAGAFRPHPGAGFLVAKAGRGGLSKMAGSSQHGAGRRYAGIDDSRSGEKIAARTWRVAQPESFFSGMLSSALMRQDPLVVTLTNMNEAGNLRLQASECNVFAKTVPPQAATNFIASATAAEEFSCQIALKRYRMGSMGYAWLIDSWKLED